MYNFAFVFHLDYAMKYMCNPNSYLLRLSYNVYWLHRHLAKLAGTCIIHINMLPAPIIIKAGNVLLQTAKNRCY